MSGSTDSLAHVPRSQTSAQRGHKDTSSRLGALLTILCSRTDLKTIPDAPSTSHSLARSLRLLYLSEAQLHLTNLHLPLPADAVVPSDVDLRTDAMAYDFLADERKAHDRTRERLKQAQVGLEKATTSGTAARTKADKCEAEAKSLRGEVSRLKGEGDILKDQAREGFRAKDEVLREVDRLKEDVERYKREAQGASMWPASSLSRRSARTDLFALNGMLFFARRRSRRARSGPSSCVSLPLPSLSLSLAPADLTRLRRLLLMQLQLPAPTRRTLSCSASRSRSSSSTSS